MALSPLKVIEAISPRTFRNIPRDRHSSLARGIKRNQGRPTTPPLQKSLYSRIPCRGQRWHPYKDSRLYGGCSSLSAWGLKDKGREWTFVLSRPGGNTFSTVLLLGELRWCSQMWGMQRRSRHSQLQFDRHPRKTGQSGLLCPL